MYFVYLLENRTDQNWYIGFTSNLKRRVTDHNSGNGCVTTARKPSWKLIYFECYVSKADALGREKFLKGGSGRKYLYKQLKNYLEANRNPPSP
jgi:putative endonuclease